MPAGLANGTRVEVRGSIAGGLLIATGITIDNDTEGTQREFELKGAITAVDTTAKTLVVRSVTVDYGSARISGGSAALLTVGRQVEITGTLSADRTRVMATQIDIGG